MRQLVAIAALIFATAVPSVASAQLFLGARLGYGFPWGEVMDGDDLKDTAKGQVPIQVDFGLKLGKALALGVYGSYGFVLLGDDFKDAHSDARASTMRFGVQANLHAENSANTEFWGGVSLGYTRLKATDMTGAPDEAAFTGFEGGLQGGFDFLTAPSFRVGPFASLTVARFTKYDFGSVDGDIDDLGDTAFHGWFQIGLRGMWGT